MVSTVLDDAADLDLDRDLFEEANLYPRNTGLPMTVWASVRGRARHDVRLKVCMTPGNRFDADNVAVVAVRPEPRLLHGDLSTDDFRRVADWIAMNEAALIAFWDGEIDGLEFASALRKLGG
jgi:hypothetical protein